MFKTALTVAAALTSQGVSAAFSESEPLATQVIQSMFEYDDYTME